MNELHVPQMDNKKLGGYKIATTKEDAYNKQNDYKT